MAQPSHYSAITTEDGFELLTEDGDYLTTGFGSPGSTLEVDVGNAGVRIVDIRTFNDRTLTVGTPNVLTLEVSP